MHEAFVLIGRTLLGERCVSEKAFYTEELGIKWPKLTEMLTGNATKGSRKSAKDRTSVYGLRGCLPIKWLEMPMLLPEAASDPSPNMDVWRWSDCESLDLSRKCPDWRRSLVSKGNRRKVLRFYVWQRHMVIGVTKILLKSVARITCKQTGTKTRALWMDEGSEKAQQKYLEYSKNALFQNLNLEEYQFAKMNAIIPLWKQGGIHFYRPFYDKLEKIKKVVKTVAKEERK